MKVPYSWLKEYIDVNLKPEALAQKLLSIGFEVEEIIYTGTDIKKVVTGRITSIAKHPNADKLQVCALDIGEKLPLTIVTGAKNVAEGDIVPVALDGAELPGGKQIVKSALRDVLSYGMLCSGKELDIDNNVIEGAEVDGILILPADTAIGVDIRGVLGLDECIFDVSITANRPDCQSIVGIARELCAVLDKKLKLPDMSFKSVSADTGGMLKIAIEDKANCRRYIGAVVKDIKIKASPKWMRDRLRNVGIRSINNIVDITNYVLTEFGQPMHAFDIRYVEGREIHVRAARSGETIHALDGKDYTLNGKMLVIADKNKPVAIAGVMGGEYSGVMPDTDTAVFESATFARASVRATSRALGLRSQASARYEKGVDIGAQEIGITRSLSLVSSLGCGTVCSPWIDVCAASKAPRNISVDVRDIDALLGIKVPKRAILRILKNLEIPAVADKNILNIEVPLYREDLENYADIAEEVIRFYGYDKLY
ncbi:MAG: phenylalanine--tRNA ligase subunit beta, partial [Clostridiales bacterium]|nr:phenylalanine--tRNA ligase subunit beta [Clostridiales bacterium]